MSSFSQTRMEVKKGEEPSASSKPRQSSSTVWALNLCAMKHSSECGRLDSLKCSECTQPMFPVALNSFSSSLSFSLSFHFERALEIDSFKHIWVNRPEFLLGIFKAVTRPKVAPLPTVDKLESCGDTRERTFPLKLNSSSNKLRLPPAARSCLYGSIYKTDISLVYF